jgi:hypothetical protein
MNVSYYKQQKDTKMSEFAPTHIETEAPRTLEATIIDFPSTPDNSKRIELDYAYEAAESEAQQREMVNKARADVERALAQNSPLVDKYKGKLAEAEVSLKVNDIETGKFYDRFYRDRKPAQKAQEEHRLAA